MAGWMVGSWFFLLPSDPVLVNLRGRRTIDKNWSIVSIPEGIATGIIGNDDKGHVLDSTASNSRTSCGAAIGQVFKLDTGQKRFSPRRKTGGNR